MELKKNPSVNIEKHKSRNFFLGLVAALSVSLVAFEWRQETKLIVQTSLGEQDDNWEEEKIPIVISKPKELPAPKINKALPPTPDPEPKPIITPNPVTEPTPPRVVDVSNLFGEEKLVDEVLPPQPVHFAEVNPMFPGGDEAMYAFLQRNLKYPKLAKEYNVQGKIYVQFIVDVDGSIRDLQILRGLPGNDLGCEAEALRVIEAMPNWKPGLQGDKAVPVIHTMAINFVLK